MPELSRDDLDRLKRLLETPEMIEILSHSMDLASLKVEEKQLEHIIKTRDEETEKYRVTLNLIRQQIEEKSQGFIHQKELYRRLEAVARKRKKSGSELGIKWLHANCPKGLMNQELSDSGKYIFAWATARVFDKETEFFRVFGKDSEFQEGNPAFTKLIDYVEALLR